MSFCDDPYEVSIKEEHRLLAMEQMRYGNLLRDLFTEDPEKLMLKQLRDLSPYLREVAALNAHFPSVRREAIAILDKGSIDVLKRIKDKEPASEISRAAVQRLSALGFE